MDLAGCLMVIGWLELEVKVVEAWVVMLVSRVFLMAEYGLLS